MLAAILVLSIDFALDPLADQMGWWLWSERLHGQSFFDVPVTNFIAWFAIVLSLSFLLRVLKIWRQAEDWAGTIVGLALIFLVVVLSLLFVIGLIWLAHAIDKLDVPFYGQTATVLLLFLVLSALVFLLLGTLPWKLNNEYEPGLPGQQRKTAVAAVTLYVFALQAIMLIVLGAELANATWVEEQLEIALWVPGTIVMGGSIFLAPYAADVYQRARGDTRPIGLVLARRVIAVIIGLDRSRDGLGQLPANPERNRGR